MKILLKLFLIVLFTLSIFVRISAQCNPANSPSFQLTTSPTSVATNGWCYPICHTIGYTSPWPSNTTTYFLPGGGSFNSFLEPHLFIPGVWTVQVTFWSNNCSTSHTVLATLLPAPIVSLTSSHTYVCFGKSATLTAVGANTYSWNTNASTSTITVHPSATTSYTIIGISSNGCSDSDSLRVEVKPLPMLEAQAPKYQLCFGETVPLTVKGATTYSWNTGETNDTIVVTPTITTLYNVIGVDQYGCESNHHVLISVSPCTEISETLDEQDQFLVFPNPAVDNLYIISKYKILQGEIQNSIGQSIGIVNLVNNTLTVSQLSPGLYTLIFFSEKKSVRFLKQ